MDVKKRIAVAIAAGSIIGATFLPVAALADTTAEISGNGAGSNNQIKITNKCTVNVKQSNDTSVNVNIDTNLNTGGNQANNNTGGNVTVSSGDATSGADVTVGGSTNSADVPSCCECTGSVDATISGNGADSTNKITDKNTSSIKLSQKNKTKVRVRVRARLKTGNNKANNNTGGDVDVSSGNAEATASVTVDPSSNTL